MYSSFYLGKKKNRSAKFYYVTVAEVQQVLHVRLLFPHSLTFSSFSDNIIKETGKKEITCSYHTPPSQPGRPPGRSFVITACHPVPVPGTGETVLS